MTIEEGPFEDVSPIKDGDLPLSCYVFGGVYILGVVCNTFAYKDDFWPMLANRGIDKRIIRGFTVVP